MGFLGGIANTFYNGMKGILGVAAPAAGGFLSSVNPLIGAGLISGIGSLGSSLLGNELGVKSSKELMDYQYKLQQQAIDAQNLYNSPAEQMKRLQSAGLNPNLVYGSGVDGNQSSAASPSAVNRNVDIANPLQDMSENYRQARLLDIQEKNSEVERQNTMAKTVGQLLDNSFLRQTMPERIKQVGATLMNTIEDAYLKASNRSLNASKANNLEALTAKYNAEIDWTKAKTATEKMRPAEVRANVRWIKAKTKLTDKQREVADSIIKLNNGKLQLFLHQMLYYDSMSDFNYSRKDFQDQMNALGFGNLTTKDKVKTAIDITKIVVGMYMQTMGAGASVAKAAL